MDGDSSDEQLTQAEVRDRLDILEYNIGELRAAARKLARSIPDHADEFDEVGIALEEAEAALRDASEREVPVIEVYRETLHRLQDIRYSFDADLLAAVDDAVDGQLRGWE